jgi:hypothetical protein
VTVYAFDVDGTLETSAGPIRVARLQELVAEGHPVVIVSPSGARPQGYPEFIGGDRGQNLREAANAYPEQDDHAYVSDNGDLAVARDWGWRYIWHREFKP